MWSQRIVKEIIVGVIFITFVMSVSTYFVLPINAPTIGQAARAMPFIKSIFGGSIIFMILFSLRKHHVMNSKS